MESALRRATAFVRAAACRAITKAPTATLGRFICVLAKTSKVFVVAVVTLRAVFVEGISPSPGARESAEALLAMPSSRGMHGRGLQVGRRRSSTEVAENEGLVMRRPSPTSAAPTMLVAPRRAAKVKGCAAPSTPSGSLKICLATESDGLASSPIGLCTRTNA